ncbi:MAG: TonB-dependent receptor [Paludibacter sp.]|nr:TonB-dependent receptor [Paludibacter sp.]
MKPSILLLLAGISIYVQPVSSQLVTDSVKNIKMKEITVFGDFPTALSMPNVVVDKSTLESSSFFTPADALQNETGLSIAHDGIWSTSINIRGFSEQRILEMVDGDRIQTATEHSGPMSTIDMNTIEKIEVIKGASSVLYGTGAMGGVVNYVTKTPDYSSVFQTKGNVGTEFNTVNNLWANFANLQFTTNQWYIGLNGSFRTAQNTMTPGGILSNSQFHDASWGIKAGIMYSPNHEFKANYQHFEGWDIGIPGGRTFPETAVARYTGIARNQMVGEYVISNINENLRQINVKAYTQNISRNVELKPADPSIIMLPGSLNKTSGAKIITDWDFDYEKHLVLGAEGWLRDAKTIRLTEKNSADTLLTVTGDLPSPNAKMYDAGIFALYSYKIIPEKLTIDAGLRFDYIQIVNDTAYNPLFRYTEKGGIKTPVINLTRNPMYVASMHENLNYAAHLDLVYNLTKSQLFTFSLSNSYRAPSIEELFKYINLGASIHEGNVNLKPEQGTFSNLNYTLLGNNFTLKADVFGNYLTNLIREIQTSSISNIWVNQNISKALFLGAELEGKWWINNHFTLLANVSYTHTRDIEANTALPQVPPLNGFASLNYNNKEIGASFSTLWAADQNDIAPNETATAGHAIFNIDAHSTEIDLKNSHLQLYAGVNNLLNTAYFDHLSSTRGVLKLELGRNIYLKVKYGW